MFENPHALLDVADDLATLPGSQADAIALRRAAKIILAAPQEKYLRLAIALRILDPRLVMLPAWTPPATWPGRGFGPLCEAYPNAPLDMAARIVLGESPAKVTGLTAKEAHEYLQSHYHRRPEHWLLRNENHLSATCSPNSVSVARWLLARWADPAQRAALTKMRTERGPHGEEVSGTFLSRLDEVTDKDLRPSVRATFEAAAARLQKALERDIARAKNQDPLAPVPRWYRPVRCATLLDRPALLLAEGKEMRHCVAVYVPYVRAQKSVVVALRVPERQADGRVVVHRSTVEIDRATIAVRQHKGAGNTAPPALCERALAVCVRRWQRQGPSCRENGGLDRPDTVATL